MATSTARLPEPYRGADEIDFSVSELVSDSAGSHSPFGELEFPVPAAKLAYVHPRPQDRPHLADGR